MSTNANSQTYLIFQYIYKSRKHILEMLKDRGFNTEELENYTQQEIMSMVQANHINKFENNGDKGPLDIHLKKKSGEAIFVKYRLEDKFKKTENLNSQINTIYSNFLKKDDTLYEEILKDAEWDEKRMDVIGQNGNDGLHYEDEYYEMEHSSECS